MTTTTDKNNSTDSKKISISQKADLEEAFARFRNVLYGLCARWGFMPEEEFRNEHIPLLTDKLGFRVERYHSFDNSGTVYGHPDQVEIDIILRDGLVIAVEIKSSIDRGDLSLFQRKITFYEQAEGIQVNRKFVVSPFIEPDAVKTAEKFGMKLYTHSSEISDT